MDALTNPMDKHSVGVAYLDADDDRHLVLHLDNGYLMGYIDELIIYVDTRTLVANYRLEIITKHGVGMHFYVDDIVSRECVYQ